MKKKQIKRQFLVNAILLQSIYNNTSDPDIKTKLDNVMEYKYFFMGKTGEIPVNVTLARLDNEKKEYDIFYNKLDKDRKPTVDNCMVIVNDLIHYSNRDTNSHLRYILRVLQAVSPLTTTASETSTVKGPVQQNPFMLEQGQTHREAYIQMVDSRVFNLIISIGETCLYVDTEPSKSLLKAKFNDLVKYFFDLNNDILKYKNNATDNETLDISAEKNKLIGFKYYSGIKEEGITNRFGNMRIDFSIVSSNTLNVGASVNYVNELNRLINWPPHPPPPP